MTMMMTRVKINAPNVVVMAQAALKAARPLLRDFGEVEQLQVSRKGPGDFVSAADHRAEKIIRTELEKARKNYSMLLEESGAIEGENKEYTWIVDPLDGTTNFLHGIPHFAIALALKHKDEIVAGVVLDPLKDELFYASKGMGMYLNDRRLRVSARCTLSDALIGLGPPHPGLKYSGEIAKKYYNHRNLNGKVAGMRRSGSAALDLAYVAAGRLDGYIAADLAPWDLAAGCLFLREAGGYVTDFNHRHQMIETGTVVAGNEHLHPSFLSALDKAA